jgi:Phage major capsid protein E
MATFVYATAAELQQVAQAKIPNLIAQRPAFDILPMEPVDSHILMWEQMDNFIGLQQIRGLNGQPPRVKKVGAKRFMMTPGIYGEYQTIDELELTERRQWGTFGQPVSIDDLIMQAQDHLLGRRLDRIEQITWTLLTTGTFSVSGPDGQVLQTDTFTLQTASAAVAWATAATATPLADFRAVQLLSRGHSVRFDQSARAYMNRVTWNNFIKNTNAADFGGKKGMGLQSLTSLGDANTILTGEGLPNIVVFDGGYLSEPSGTFVPFIADAKVVVVGQRTDGGRIGEYRMTRNANNPGLAPGAYMEVIDRGEPGPGKIIPRTIEVHDGHNGGPVIYFPSAIVILSV